MDNKNFKMLIVLIVLLAISILMMGISLLLSERMFGRISSYLAIGCVIITLIGVAVIVITNRKKNKDDDDK